MLKKYSRWLLVLIVAAVVIAGVLYALRPKPVPVDAGVAQVGTLRISVDEEGKTRIKDRYIVSSPLTGRLRRITLDPGDTVVAQQTTLAVIAPTNPDLLDARALAEAEARVRAAEASVRQSGATLESAKAASDYAENELARITNAFKQGAANKHELDAAETAHRTAREAYRAAEYGREISQYELELARSALLYARGEQDDSGQGQMSLASPIDGVVLRVMQESDAVVNPGTPLIEVGNPLDLEIVVDVLSTDAVGITPGDRVVIDHWGGDE
ncbi:MAG TPA: HlyD family efflux transporter periplasmic adaptor subunit, partial [Gammaproteobacteria bacterium]|nr:HlyD family efflux transporter periplasmic adaptor subunit [Gammaproteobacteria bacterium]